MPYGFAGANNSSARWNGSISIFCKTCWFLFSEIFGGVTQGSSVLNMNVKLTTRADDLVCVALVWEVDGREASCEIRVCKKNPWTLVMIGTSALLQLCNFETTFTQFWDNLDTTLRQLEAYCETKFSRRTYEQWWWYVQLRTLAEMHFYTFYNLQSTIMTTMSGGLIISPTTAWQGV